MPACILFYASLLYYCMPACILLYASLYTLVWLKINYFQMWFHCKRSCRIYWRQWRKWKHLRWNTMISSSLLLRWRYKRYPSESDKKVNYDLVHKCTTVNNRTTVRKCTAVHKCIAMHKCYCSAQVYCSTILGLFNQLNS